MYISSITLTDYRNFNRFSLSFDTCGNVLYGNNGIGKTNLLEAICYFAYGKSFRASSDNDLIRHGQEYFTIKGQFCHQNEGRSFAAAYDRKGRKQIKIDSQRVDKLSELYRILKVVFFSQNDINLITGSPKQRRHFFDLAIAQFNYRYIDYLRDYNQTVKQRNALLKGNFRPQEKGVWDEKLSAAAANVIHHRLQYLSHIRDELAIVSDFELNDKQELLGIEYKESLNYTKKNTDAEIGQLKEIFYQQLQIIAKEEVRYQRTMVGPHLDDYRFTLDKRDISRFGSHGQKRCFVILLGLAQSRLISKTDQDAAIMIFDDVLSDLDSERTKAILVRSITGKNQIFIATPNPEPYSELQLPLIDIEREIKG